MIVLGQNCTQQRLMHCFSSYHITHYYIQQKIWRLTTTSSLPKCNQLDNDTHHKTQNQKSICSKMYLFALPDELWISILHEWINKPIFLCAFDIALCNRLLREIYLIWLHDKTTNGAFNIFSHHIHFETTHQHGNYGMSHQGVPATFFDWCKTL